MSASYDPILVLASMFVAIMASYTGLRLLMGLRSHDLSRKKVQIAKAATALGGGIWSMHFVAMLALNLPIVIYYDALYTLGSALIAILITGLGLSLMHVGERTFYKTAGAGTLIGLGIASMHYVGMAAIQGNCIVEYAPFGFIISIGIAILFSCCALSLAYRNRNLMQLGLASIVLGVTIAGMHYSAMAFTGFVRIEGAMPALEPLMADSNLALFVAMSAFLVCGMFLLTALPLREQVRISLPDLQNASATTVEEADDGDTNRTEPSQRSLRVPYEQNKRTYFLEADLIRAIKAEGHYTRILDGENSLFCPWSISRLEDHLAELPFVRTHRSFLLNLRHALSFQRHKDTALVFVAGTPEIEIPVSRSHLGDVRRALGL